MAESRELKKDDIVTVEITDLDSEGQGIGKAGGLTLFVKDAFVGDVARVKVMKMKKTYGYARLMEVVQKSPDRIAPECPIARACGGCQLQEISYEAELRFKENKVKNNLIRIGGFEEKFIESVREPIVGMENPVRYRNKAQYPVGKDKEGNPVAGFYAGRTHSIIPCTDCRLGREVNEVILKTVLEFMKEESVEPYDEVTGRGFLRHVLIREGFFTGEIMVCFIGTGKQFPKCDLLCQRLVEKVPEIKSISLNVNSKNTNVIMGDETITLWGKGTIEDVLGGISFRISPKSFYQVNPVQTEKLYAKAVEYAALTGRESLWDLYCGIGTISLTMAKKAGCVYGVEIVPEAIRDAKENADRNGISNAEFFVGKAEEVLPAFYHRTFDTEGSAEAFFPEEPGRDMLHPDVIVVDPPRKGCDEKCLETMLLMEPGRIVYVSCDSATLARDLKILCAEKYELKAWQCYDQFSRTVHVEVAALLTRLSNRKADSYVKLNVKMEDYNKNKNSKMSDIIN